MLDFAIVTNTNSVNSDLWRAYVERIKKYMGETIYIFSDEFDLEYENVKLVPYDPKLKFRSQYLSCIKQIEEEFCLYLNEDYILYDEPDYGKLEEYINVLKGDESISFIKLLRGLCPADDKYSETLYRIDPKYPYFFSHQASLWRTRDLEAIHEEGPDLHIAGKVMEEQFEVAASKTCKDMGISGLFHFSGEDKRGMHHYDSSVFPYIATALVKGRWNMSEYHQEMSKLLAEYKIDPYTRGIV